MDVWKGIKFGVIILSLLSLGAVACAQNRIIWQDTFSGQKINAKKWTVLQELPYKNNELQIYSAKNVIQKHGKLSLLSTIKQGHYYSGAIVLNRNYAWQYGRLQIRAKLPTGKGLFPAFWLMTASGKRLPEIDLMEMLGHKPDEVWMVEHYWDEAKKHRRSYSVYNGTDFSRGFHTYELDWRASGVTWRIDGKRVHHTRQAPHEPMYIILNTAIGGNWPGRPDATTNFPQTLQVDWIKVSR